GLSDGGRAHQKVLRQLEIAVVLHHAAIKDLGSGSAIESLEMFILEGSADLDGSVTAEVEEHDGGAVTNGPDRLTLLIDDDEARQELVDDSRIFVSQCLDGFG